MLSSRLHFVRYSLSELMLGDWLTFATWELTQAVYLLILMACMPKTQSFYTNDTNENRTIITTGSL